MRALAAVGVLIGVAAGAVSLLFTLVPSISPCFADTEATFTDVPVFPRASYRAYLVRGGARHEDAARQPAVRGAEVRFSYRTSGLRGKNLAVTSSLLIVDRAGTVGSVVPRADRVLALRVTPSDCTQTGGYDLFVMDTRPGKRYRVVLELYRDDALTDRIALGRTEIFRG